MILILAPNKQWADIVARERHLRHREWRYVLHPQHLRGYDIGDVTILIHEQWHEAPHMHWADVCQCGQQARMVTAGEWVHDADDSAVHGEVTHKATYHYPLTETIEMYRILGAKIEYVTT